MKPLIIGNGRVAKNLIHYCSTRKLTYFSWNRQENSVENLSSLVQKCDRVLLAISDRSLADFYNLHLKNSRKLVIHFSGATKVDGAVSIHPLTSFPADPMPAEVFEQIPMIVFSTQSFEELLPGFKNPWRPLDENRKAEYHAHCVMSGNFTTLLWQNFFSWMEQNQLPSSFAHQYLKQIENNLVNNWHQALTGPFSRGDQKTIEANLSALSKDPASQKLYSNFFEFYIQKRGHQ